MNMKTSIIYFSLFICGSAHASLEGDYALIKGATECPVGSLQIKIDKKNQERILLFGSRHSWTINMLDLSTTKEVVEGGCTYNQSYEKTDKSFICKTVRTNCPTKSEEGIVTEKINLKDSELTYEFDLKKVNYKCQYKKISKP